ncbi:MAG: P-type conjugative transfer protein TrbG [Sphingobium sp.]
MIHHAFLSTAIMLAAVPASAQERASPVSRVAAANRSATEQPAALGFVNASQIYAFADGMIYQGYTAPGSITDIALQPGEALVAVASGDTARWVIGDTTSGSGEAKRTHILVKPFAAGLVTNLLITTDRRAYHVRLTSTARTPMSSIRWSYPQDDMLAFRRQAEPARAAQPVASGLTVEQLRFDYGISGDKPGWRPLRAFDDGRQTYIEFPASLAQGDAPPLFVIGADGKAELVNYRLRERYYIVDRLFDTAELRLGAKKQQVVRITRGVHAKRGRGA